MSQAAPDPETDIQQLRALIRQARKDAQPAGKEANVQVSQGLAPRKAQAARPEPVEGLGPNGSDDRPRIRMTPALNRP